MDKVSHPTSSEVAPANVSSTQTRAVRLRHAVPQDIPNSVDILTALQLSDELSKSQAGSLSLIAAGDIMLGGRTTSTLSERGEDYPFEAVMPLLQRAPVVLGNLEGPFAKQAKKQDRRYSYRVKPRLVSSLYRAGINVVTLANNHLLDCGRSGVIETLEALKAGNVQAIGGGTSIETAHSAAILDAHGLKIGLLGYYWNSRTSATAALPGSAIDSFENLQRDIGRLRSMADRVVVTCHWGVPYERQVSPEDRAKARFAIDCGADAIIGHHPHVIQSFEIYRGVPIIYSVGNFTFGSGNSRAEGMLVGLRFEEARTQVEFHPLYVKNRDPRVNYQPKALRGKAAERIFSLLESLSNLPTNSLDRMSTYACISIPRISIVRRVPGDAHG